MQLFVKILDGRTIIIDVSPFWQLQTLINCIKNKQQSDSQFFLYHIQGAYMVLLSQEKLDAILFNDLNLKNEDCLEVHGQELSLQKNLNIGVQLYNTMPPQVPELIIIQYSQLQDHQNSATLLSHTNQAEHVERSFWQSSICNEQLVQSQSLSTQQQNYKLKQQLEKRNLQLIQQMEQNIQYKNIEIARLKYQNDQLLQNNYNIINIQNEKDIQIQKQQKLLEEQKIQIKKLQEIINSYSKEPHLKKFQNVDKNKGIKKVSGNH